jgi:hypothetical protein
MRALLFLVIVIALLAFAGWLTFSSGPGRTSVNLETDEIRQDTQEIVRSGSKILNDARDGVATPEENNEPADEETGARAAELE